MCLGTTAENATLTQKERDGILSFCLENASGRAVIAGAGGNCTREAVKSVKRACSLGAQGVLSVCPYYNKPPESGIIAHFCKIAEASRVPVILYDVPSRTGTEISVNAIYKLSGLHNITGIKAAGNDPEKLKEISALISDDFALFGGNDFLTVETLASGAAGLISAAANVMPNVFAKIIKCFFAGERQKAAEIFTEYETLIRALYVETNPVAVKYALSVAGLIKNELRLPMCPISHKNALIVEKALSKKIKEVL